ncbi:TonB-dependent receptor [bacterium]|nr:TonB-dependent receptor [bacterium]NUN44499.1 TonB-dependent receptor [bacterium]
MMKSTIYIGLLWFAIAEYYSQTGDSVKIKQYDLQGTVITSSRLINSRNASSALVNVITEENIQRRGATNLSDALSGASGIQIKDFGGASGLKLPSLRGSTSEQVIIMIDGIPLNNPATGLIDLGVVPLTMIDHIETYKGGDNNAVGGTINLITKKQPRDEPMSIITKAHYSSFKRQWLSAGLTGFIKKTSYNFAYEFEYQPDSSYFVTVPSSGERVLRVNSESKRHALFLNVNNNLSLKTDFSLMGQWTFRDIEIPGTISNNTSVTSRGNQEDRVFLIAPQIQHRFNDQWHTAIGLSWYQYQFDYTNSFPTTINSRNISNSYHTRWTNLITLLKQHTFNLGVTHTFVQGEGDNTDHVSNQSVSVFADDQWLIPLFNPMWSFRLSPAIRWDKFSDFGQVWSPKAGMNISYEKSGYYTSLRASWSRNFRAPTLNERYWKDTDASGNPDIKPERSTTWDLGGRFGGSQGKHSFEIEYTWFVMRAHNQIAWNLAGIIHPENIRKSSSRGRELAMKYEKEQMWETKFELSRAKAVDTSDPDNVRRIPYNPLYTASLSNYAMFKDFTIGHTTHYQSQRYTDAANNSVIPSYWLTDAIVSWHKQIISYDVQLSVIVKNIFDKAYESVAQYPGLAREYVVGTKITF